MTMNFDLSLIPNVQELKEMTKLGQEQAGIDLGNVACMALDIFLGQLMDEAAKGQDNARLWESDVTALIIQETNLDSESAKDVMHMIEDFLDKNTVFYVDNSYEYKDYEKDNDSQLSLFLSWSDHLIERKAYRLGHKDRVEEFKKENKNKTFTKSWNPRIIKDELGNKYKKVDYRGAGFLAKPKDRTHYTTRNGERYFIITGLVSKSENETGFFYNNMKESFILNSYFSHEDFDYYKPIN